MVTPLYAFSTSSRSHLRGETAVKLSLTQKYSDEEPQKKHPESWGDNSGLLLSPDPLLQSERRFLGIDLAGPTVCWWACLFLPGDESYRSSSPWRFTFGFN